MAHHFILVRLHPFDLRVIGRGGGLSTLCHNCGFSCQNGVLKTVPNSSYLHSEDEVVWVWHWLGNLCIYKFVCIIPVYNKTYHYLSIPNKWRFSFLIFLSHIKNFFPVLENRHIVIIEVSIAYMRMEQRCLKWHLA